MRLFPLTIVFGEMMSRNTTDIVNDSDNRMFIDQKDEKFDNGGQILSQHNESTKRRSISLRHKH